MFDSKNRKSGCEFGEFVVEFLYGELSVENLAAFRSHLDSCTECSDDISSLATVSSALGEWKSTAFDSVVTPEIAIPYDAENGAATAAGVRFSVFGKISDLFALYHVAFKTAAALAVVVFVAALGFIYFGGGPSHRGIAEGNPDNETPPVQTTPKSESPSSKMSDLAFENVEKQEAEIDEGSENALEQPKPLKTSSPVTKRVVGTSTPRKAVKRKAKQKPDANDDLPSPSKLTQVERLTTLAASDEAEDEGLRLIELFEDSGSDER